MTGHLPECGVSFPCGVCGNLSNRRCICDRLRACEQRVRMEDDDYAYVSAQAEADGRRRGWSEALDAAREAVETLPPLPLIVRLVKENKTTKLIDQLIDRDEAVAAIDALREKP